MVLRTSRNALVRSDSSASDQSTRSWRACSVARFLSRASALRRRRRGRSRSWCCELRGTPWSDLIPAPLIRVLGRGALAPSPVSFRGPAPCVDGGADDLDHGAANFEERLGQI